MHNIQQSSVKQKLLVLIKCAVIVFCTGGFGYQSYTLCREYLKGQTVVTIKVEQIKYNRIPGLTVCYPQLVSMESMASDRDSSQGWDTRRQQWSLLFQDYRRLLESLTNDWQLDGKNLSRQLRDLYYQQFSHIVDQSVPVRQLFRWSIPFAYQRNSSLFTPDKPTDYSIDMTVRAIRLFRNNRSIDTVELRDTDPIESIVLPDDDHRQGFKCFTFFSHLRPVWRQYQVDLKHLQLDIYHHENWFPPTLYNSNGGNDGGTGRSSSSASQSPPLLLSLAMHSPLAIPQQMSVNNFIRLKPGKWYEMTYNRWKTWLLPEPYDTRCRNYDIKTGDNIGEATHDYSVRTDCVNACVYQQLRQRCGSLCVYNNTNNEGTGVRSIGPQVSDNNCTECFYRSDSLWRRSLAFDGCYDPGVGGGVKHGDCLGQVCPKLLSTKTTTTNVTDKDADVQLTYRCLRQELPRVTSECENNTCPMDCVNHFYNLDIKTTNKMPDLSTWSRHTRVEIAHNQLPDQITQHIPEMSFTQFAGNFGGLLGMWLGLSALAIMNFLLSLV